MPRGQHGCHSRWTLPRPLVSHSGRLATASRAIPLVAETARQHRDSTCATVPASCTRTTSVWPSAKILPESMALSDAYIQTRKQPRPIRMSRRWIGGQSNKSAATAANHVQQSTLPANAADPVSASAPSAKVHFTAHFPPGEPLKKRALRLGARAGVRTTVATPSPQVQICNLVARFRGLTSFAAPTPYCGAGAANANKPGLAAIHQGVRSPVNRHHRLQM